MKYRETDKKGSFDACGTGFDYKYHSGDRRLAILSERGRETIYTIDFDEYASRNPRGYVEDIDKAAQIYALMFSNNQSIELPSIFEGERLLSILKNASRLARYSYDLQSYDFPRFRERFCRHFALREIEIRKIYGRSAEDDFYVAKLKTQRNNATSAISESLHGIMKDLSEKTVQDLIMSEYGSFNQSDAHNLLTVSTNLSTISRILDKQFAPHRYIAKYSKTPMSELLKKE